MSKTNTVIKIILIPVFILVFIALLWTAFALIGRVKADSVIPPSATLRLSVSNPVRLIDNVLAHESLGEISKVPSLRPAVPVIAMLMENPLLKNRLVRLAARGNFEFAFISPDGNFAAIWDMGIFSPLLRVLPMFSRFVNIPDLYYVQAGRNSRFEYRLEDMTLFIGPYRNLLFITNNSAIYGSRTSEGMETAYTFNNIKPSAFDVAMLLSPDLINVLLSDQDANIAAILNNIDFGSTVEAGISVFPKRIEFRLMAPMSSRQSALNNLLEQRSTAPNITERLPASTQYATVMSAGTLNELFQVAQIFSGPVLEETLRMADSSSRTILGLTLDDLLFSWTGNEFAVFGMEGRPHPVYAIQIADERRRQAVFDRAFRSIALGENLRLNLDGVRIPRIEVPEFLQSLLRRWNIFLPSPYYTIYRDYMLVSESAETLLSALRAIQRNDVLPRTEAWRYITGARTIGGFNIGNFTAGSAAVSAFSLYYSLDLSMPFFLRRNTTLSSFLGLYRQGLIRMSFDAGLVDISFALVPGFGGGVTLISAEPVEARGRISNRIFGAGRGEDGRVFLSAGDTVLSVNPSDNSSFSFSGQGTHWIIPADGAGDRNDNVWVVSDRGRVTLMNNKLEPVRGFPVLTGIRLTSPPVAHNGKVYICDEDGRVHSIDASGELKTWETTFITALRSPPSFLTLSSRGRGTRDNVIHYAAVYPKSFFGEIWLLDSDGKALPGWPVPVSKTDDDIFGGNSGIGFGSPLLFAHNNRVLVSFVCQAGELSVYGENGIPFSPFPILLEGVFFLQPVFDGEYLWLVSSEGTLFRISLSGEILYQHIPNFTVKEEGYITTFDIDGDRIPEVFISGEGNALFGFTRNFRSLEGFPLPIWGRPVFGDFSGKGNTEILGIGMDRRLYRWQFR
jgi:hypothetical protein